MTSDHTTCYISRIAIHVYIEANSQFLNMIKSMIHKGPNIDLPNDFFRGGDSKDRVFMNMTF